MRNGVIIFCFMGCLISASGIGSEADAITLRIGVLPIVESLPFIVAEKQRLFQSSGLKVEIITFASALERDSAIHSGRIHGAIHDILGLGLLRSKGIPYSIITNITVPTAQHDLFMLLASPGSGIKSVEDLRGGEIALSSHTIAEYVTDSLLSIRGLKIEEVKKVEVKKILLRFQLLMENKVKAAILPEPLASLAVYQRAKKLGGDYGLKGTQVVLVFQDSLLRGERETLIRLGRAYRQAVRMINENPKRWRKMLVEKGRLPLPIKEVYTMPPFSEIQIPRPDEIGAVKIWMEGKKFEISKIDYASMVNDIWVKGGR